MARAIRRAVSVVFFAVDMKNPPDFIWLKLVNYSVPIVGVSVGLGAAVGWGAAVGFAVGFAVGLAVVAGFVVAVGLGAAVGFGVEDMFAGGWEATGFALDN